MYGWIWRNLPGNVWSKSAQSVLLVLLVVSVLLFVVFPWVEPRLWFTKVTVGR
ncbi:MAG: hypothetical protein JO147_09195 [Actinobacteria bacterium]|nr:hypothetical protein [Actinomycetota bacterium]